MAFSDGFAKGFAIGDAMRKRRATAKYFERFKELTDDEDAEPVTSIGGIDVPESVAGSPDGNTALPLPQASAPLATPEGALPLDAPLIDDAALPAPKIKAPKKIPISEDFRKSLNQNHIKELDRLAMDAARTTGDITIYNALQGMTDSFLQGKTLKHLASAQTALSMGKTEEAEQSLIKAYRYVPDGHEAKFKKKDGKLFTKDPWDDTEVELTAQHVSMFSTLVRDPEKWGEIVRSERAEKGRAAREQKRLDLEGERVGIAKDSLTEDKRGNMVQELMANKEYSRSLANDKVDRLYKMALAGKALADAAAVGTGSPDGMRPDDMRQYGESVAKSLDGFLTPTKPADPSDPFAKPGRAAPPPGYEMFVSDEGGMSELGLQAKELGGMLGIANPQIGPDAAARAGLELTRALVDDSGPKITVSPSNGTITVLISGRPTTLKLPEEAMNALIEAGKSDAEKK